jgi:hypothetical protein
MTRLDPAPALASLKDFQRRTVDYVFQRMWLDDPPALRFLVADEVGLGKTMVARGIIARTLDHLQDTVRRLDVVYVCSNAAIASQNINRLNVLGDQRFSYASRLTLLPQELHHLEQNRVNFISFTPGTTFNLRSSGGVKEERALLFRMLADAGFGRETPLLNALQCTAGRDKFRRLARDRSRPISDDLAALFVERLRKERKLVARVEEMCDRFYRARKSWPDEDSRLRYAVIGDLRELLAHVCVDALEPDLVILDEFQRFKDLLRTDTEAGELAHTLMTHVTPEQNDVRVLLLSATPYRSYTTHHDADEDHYADFLDTTRFLFGDDEAAVAGLDRELRALRAALYGVDDDASFDRLAAAQGAVQRRLLSVMSRTERVGRTADLDGMLVSRILNSTVEPHDLGQASLVHQVADVVGAGDPIEYWKSAPYLLAFMKDYELKRRLEPFIARPNPELARTLRAHRGRLLKRRQVEDYEPIAHESGRLRTLVRDMVNGGAWRVLWVPPAMPYLEPGGAYAEVGDLTKALVFSSWNVVPDVIAGLCSYEVERRVMEADADRPPYHELITKRRGLLRYALNPDGEPRNMSTLAALYPSLALADAVDPVRWACDAGAPLPANQARLLAAASIERRLTATGHWPPRRNVALPDARWYWVALALLDRDAAPDLVPWCLREWARVAAGDAGGEDAHEDGAFARHVDRFAAVLSADTLSDLGLADPPDDLIDMLVDLALGSPAVCALRALRRVTDADAADDTPPEALWSDAVRVAEGFRTLYNVPMSMTLLRAGADDDAYWRAILTHGIQGNLQAVLDEYAHLLVEWLGLHGHAPAEVVEGVAIAMGEALSIRTVPVMVDEVGAGKDDRVNVSRFSMRCRYALRFTELRDDSGRTLARLDTVRKAFNSPFRPFILATTSIGQEGLDFHPYCHVVYHWNLPTNPVDLEQREGRVHRYKGHAVRKNIARKYGLAAVDGAGDPWQALFDHALAERDGAHANDLYPYWLFPLEDGARIERRVPMLPLSRDQGRFERLRRSLAIYRMVFGQPRQEDLLDYLRERIDDPAKLARLAEYQIRLEPPEVEVGI